METIRHIVEMKGEYHWSVGPDDSVYDALRIMANKDVGALLVMEGENLIGIISERDYARKIILLGRTSRQTKVKEIMSSPVITIHPDQTIDEAVEIMTDRRVRHLPVSDDGLHVLGVVSIGDLMRCTIYYQKQKIRNLKHDISKQNEAIAELEETLGRKYEHRNRFERLVP
jgi:signal-transduction protein with cAMP-binding, CBS, and nucleotidyltransferase domain